jgi:hypothetical protein
MPELRVGGVVVAAYVEQPRPHLHPVRTLGGTVVTDAAPPDHPWHLGVSVAVQDVGGWNFWGGRTYVRDQGYVSRPDHGRIEHVAFTALDAAGFTDHLRWVAPGEVLQLDEQRSVRAERAGPGWTLAVSTTLTNATGQPLPLGSPATNGRIGAGYGGLFWRLPPAREPSVRTASGTGESRVHGVVAPQLTWADPAAGFSLTFTSDDGDPWFVRVADYPGVGLQLAAEEPVVLQPGGAVTRSLRVLVADQPQA